MKKMLTLFAVLCGAVGGWHACAAVNDQFNGVPVIQDDASNELWYRVISEPDESKNTGTVRVIAYPSGDGLNYQRSSYKIPEMVRRANDTSGTVYVVVKIDGHAFKGCTSLTSVILPESLTTLDSSAFRDSGLISVTLPKTLTTVGVGAFQDCTRLTSVTLPEDLTSIEASTFRGCTSLSNIVIPDSVTTIGTYAFYDCTSLPSISLPASVKTIGNKAFEGCASLSNIVIPDSVTTIDGSMFRNCTNLTSIKLPEGLTKLDGPIFEGCMSLSNIVIPDGVTTIGMNTFNGCTSLSNIVIPDGVTTIGNKAFYNCTSLESVTIPNTVTNIGQEAFLDCTKLTGVTIPGSVTSIGDYAFRNTSNITIMVGYEDIALGTSVFADNASFVYVLSPPEITVNESTQTITWTAGSSRADRYDIILYSVDGTQLYNAMEVYERSFNYANWLTTTGKYYCEVRARDWIVATGETQCEPSEYAQSESFLSVRFDANGVAALPVKSTEVDAALLTLNKMTRTIDVPQSDGEVIAVPLKVGLIVGGTVLEPTYTAHLQFATDMSAEQRAAVTPTVTDFRVTAEGVRLVVGESVAGLWYGYATGASVAAVQAAGVSNITAPFVAGTGGEVSFEMLPTTDTQRFFKILVSPYNPGYGSLRE